jgi:hypothetical protein
MSDAPKPRRTKRREELDLLPKEEGMKRADDLLRALLKTPSDPQTPKPAPKAKRKR